MCPDDRSTEERLLDAAEYLFAEDGLRETSVRAVAAAAGQSNVSAVGYYFGSREGLIRATLARRLEPLVRERLRLLEACEAESADRPALEAVLSAYFTPAMETYRRHPQSLRFTGRLVTEADSHLHGLYSSFFAEMTPRFLQALRKALPELPESEILWRWHFVLGVGVHTWTNFRDLEALSEGRCDLRDAEAVVRRLVAFCAAGLKAPLERSES
jgi:AcrR family transcriptional regulator